MRLLGATRLSHLTDESTSIIRQREAITHTALARGDVLVHVTEDTDVSGAVNPFLRESLGPWMCDPDKLTQWDGLIVAKLDRLTRSLSDFDDLVHWCDRNGKTLISVSENIDLSTSTGRMMANLLAMFAQFERERMSERRKEAAVKIRDNGWWAGFGYPYGTKPVKVDNHWELTRDEENYATLTRIAGMIVKGNSASTIAKMLTGHVPTPAGGKEWRQNTIRDMFTAETCVLEEPLLSQVREALDTTKQSWTKRGDAALLLNVATCVCGAGLFSKRYTSKGKLYEYYDCSANCGARRIPMAELNADVTEQISYLTGTVYRKIIIKGVSTAKALQVIERKIRTLDLDDEATRAELMAERAALMADNGSQMDRIELEDTGMDAGQYWATLDSDVARRTFLLKSGIKASKCRRTPEGVRCEILSDESEFIAV